MPILLLLIFHSVAGAGGGAGAVSKDEIVRKGVRIRFSIKPPDDRSAEVREGDHAEIGFHISDASTGAPMQALKPSAWVHKATGPAGESDGEACKNKIKSYLRGSLAARPDIDLNSYFVLALNQDATVSVIDPLVGITGMTRLYAKVILASPGEDWVFGPDAKQLFITMPKSSRVAVVDTDSFKVREDINAGEDPVRIAMQPDARYLWVGNDSADKGGSGVTVIDPATLKAVSRIQTGAGRHEIAFSPDSLLAFITNRDEDTVSVIDVQGLRKLRDVATGGRPSSIATSALADAVYAVHEDGAATVMDAGGAEITRRLTLKPGLKTIRFTPDGRWGFITNEKEDLVYVLDASNNEVAYSLSTGKAPGQIAFTNTFAYVHSMGGTEVTLVKLDSLGKGTAAVVQKIVAGQRPPGDSRTSPTADLIHPAAGRDTILITNPSDKFIYYYMEGMEVPMGSFQGYGHTPKAVLVADRGLRESAGGLYSAKASVPGSGRYEAAFLLDSPRMFNCFEFTVRSSPLYAGKKKPPTLKFLTKERTLKAGEPFRLRFELDGPSGPGDAGGGAAEGIRDIVAQATLMPGLWQERYIARYAGNGIYEVEMTVPKPGIYYIFFSSASLKASFAQLPRLVLRAGAP